MGVRVEKPIVKDLAYGALYERVDEVYDERSECEERGNERWG
jgi:hypothetical protein